MSKISVAVVGCGHGELNLIYSTIQKIEMSRKSKIDLCIICGDFQACRNMGDLNTMACPDRYKKMMDFYKYYNGELKAPIPTIFVGGNHEASNHLLELYYGGWVAENMYFLGFSGCVNFKGLRIAGLSGIFKGYDFQGGYHEKFPFNKDHQRSIYHYRKFEVSKLSSLTENIDIFISHDWPRGIWNEEVERRKKMYFPSVNDNNNNNNLEIENENEKKEEIEGEEEEEEEIPKKKKRKRKRKRKNNNNNNNESNMNNKKPKDLNIAAPPPKFHPKFNNIMRIKNHLFKDVEEGNLGSPPLMDLCKKLKPKHWVSGHLHQNFRCFVNHKKEDNSNNEQEKTCFLGLDKAVPMRNFMKVLDFNVEENEENKKMLKDPNIYYDEEWLSIIHASQKYFSLGRRSLFRIPIYDLFKKEIEESRRIVQERREGHEGGRWKNLVIHPNNFIKWDNSKLYKPKMRRRRNYNNNQNQQFEEVNFFKTPQGYNLDNPQRTNFLRFLGMEKNDYISFMSSNTTISEPNPEKVNIQL